VSMLCKQQAQSNGKVNAHERGKNAIDTSRRRRGVGGPWECIALGILCTDPLS